VTQRDKAFGLKVLTNAGMASVILIVGAVLLALTAKPAAAPTRILVTEAATRAMQQPSDAPAYTATPRSVASPTPEALPVMPPTKSTALPQEVLASPTHVPPAEENLPLPTPSAIPTSTPQPFATVPIVPFTSASTPEEITVSPELPLETLPETPTPVVIPSATPTQDPSETPSPPSPPATPSDLVNFESFLLTNRNTIAGQPFDIVSLTMEWVNGNIPRFVLTIAGNETDNVFATQSAADVIEYGRTLLDDVKRYLGDVPCEIAVENTYTTPSTDACSDTPAWCTIGDFEQSTNTWPVTWTYVRGSYSGVSDTLEAWNTGL
jgi:hypothetical protein